MRSWPWWMFAAAATLVFQLWVCMPLLEDYVPTNDDIALVVASTELGGWGDVAGWVTGGFRSYFLPYPEWNEFRTDFLRPLANVLYWLHHKAFGAEWGTQLIVGYVAHAVVVGLTGYLALSVFGLTKPFACIAILISALNPAYWSRTGSPYSVPYLAQFPIYQTEIVCALLMLAAVCAFIRNRYALFAGFGALALLLKETALPLTMCALLLAAAWRPPRLARSLLWLSAPLGLWLTARLAFFEGGQGIYAVMPTRELGWLLQPLRNLLLWPTGLYAGPVPDTLEAMRMLDIATLATHAVQLGTNAAWWGLVVVAVVVAWQAWRRGAADRPEAWAIVLVFALGNLGFVILPQATSVRLGYLWFAVGPAAMFVVLSRWRAGLGAAVALGVGLAAPQVWSITQSFSEESIRSYRLIKQSARHLATVLGEIPSSVNVVYLVDDLVAQTVSPHYKARLARFKGRLIYVNNVLPIAGCRSSAERGRDRYGLTREGTTTRLEYRAHECLKPGWNVPPRQHFDGNNVRRGEWLTYHFPDLTTTKGKSAAGRRSYDLGRRFSVRSTDPACRVAGACVWLGLDPADRRYYPIAH